MIPPNENKSFMDRGTLIAIFVVMVFWVAWSSYMEKKYPSTVATSTPAPAQVQTPVSPSAPGASVPPQATQAEAGTQAPQVAAQPPVEESFLEFNDPNLSFQISSSGMGLKNINIKAYQTRDNKPIILGDVGAKYPFGSFLLGRDEPIRFSLEKTNDVTFVGQASVNGLNILKTMTVDPAKYTIATEIKVSGAPQGFPGIGTYLSDKVTETVKAGFLAPAIDFQDIVYLHDGSRSQAVINPEDGVTVAEEIVNIVALSSHYFTMAVVDHSPILPRLEAAIPAGAKTAIARLNYRPTTSANEFVFKYEAYAGPKSLSILNEVDAQLGNVVNYGMFAWIAKPLLWLLKFFNSLFNNYGWAIIALTIIVRLIVLPFNVYSYRSMKVMQKVQPEMQALRERYKDDPQTLNREVMELMRRHKANPLGGCLPMLLQLPVFLALYQVLGQSIELYREPFVLWIHDLSIKDPYYVLPVLMGITMFIQQKITPSTMDPAQAKVLMWMPVIFAFFMISLPSGLTLYIFVSTLFGVAQQFAFMREKAPGATRVSRAQA